MTDASTPSDWHFDADAASGGDHPIIQPDLRGGSSNGSITVGRRPVNTALALMTKPDEALYQSIAVQSEKLSYRNKLRLAQLLIQLARKEEEETYPQERVDAPTKKLADSEMAGYVAERIIKLRPGKKSGVLNAIGAMFQFQGGVSDQDKEAIVKELIRRKVLTIDASDRVTYSIA